ncbi:MAG: PAS domain S-box protein [Paludibacter sp.]
MKKRRQTTILVASAEVVRLRQLADILTGGGYRIYSVRTGSEVFAGIRTENPDMVLIETKLPDVSGFEVCKLLKEANSTSRIPVIFINELSDRDEIRKAFAVGGADYITYPFIAEEILARVEMHLAHNRRGKEQEEVYASGIKLAVQGIVAGTQMEKKLRESEDRLEFALGGTNDGVWDVNMENNEVYLSPRGCEILGYEPERLREIVSAWSQLVHPDDITETNAALSAYLVGKTPVFNVEQRLKMASGVWKWIHTRGKVVAYNEANQPLRMVGTHTDITDRKQAENALKQSEDKFKKVFLTSPNCLTINRLGDGMYVALNPGFTDIIGYTENEMLGKTSVERNIWYDLSDRKKWVDELNKNGKVRNFEARFRRKSGDVIYGLVSASVIELGGVKHVISVMSDITEKKVAEKSLRESEEKFRDIFEYSAEGKSITSLDGRLKVNKAFCDIVGYTEDELNRLTWREITYPDDIVVKQREIELLMGGKKRFSAFESRFIHKNGSTVWVDLRTVLRKDDNGNPLYFFTSIIDITERKLGEMALLESESRYHTLFNSSFEAILLTSPDGTILSANQAACTMFGLTEEELCRVGREGVIDSSDPGLPAALEERARTGKFSGEITFIRSDGKKFPAEVSSSFFKDRDGNVRTSMIIRDITDRKRAQDELQANRHLLNKLLTISTEFIDSGFGSIDYKKTTDTILEISGAKYASFNLVADDGFYFETVAMSGLDDIQQKAKSILGYDVIHNRWKYDPVRAAKLNGIINQFDSFFELVGSSIPKPLTQLIEKMFSLGEVYVVQIMKNNKAIGDFTLLFRKGNTMKNREIVELYANQVGLFLDRLNSEKALGKSEETYRNLVMRIPDGVYKSTTAGRFLDVNPAMIRMLGYENKEEMMRVNILTDLYFDLADRGVIMTNDQKEVMSEFRLKKKDGTGIWIEDHGWFNTDAEGNIISHEGVLRDITERKLTEISLEEKMKELIRFHDLTVDRELAMIELKKEVNELLKQKGGQEKYKIIE